jgi:hypothetical protein
MINNTSVDHHRQVGPNQTVTTTPACRSAAEPNRIGRSQVGPLQTVTLGPNQTVRIKATRDGAPPLDLIDGRRLCDLLKQYELGVRTTIRHVEDVEVVGDFFDEL